MSDSAGRVLFLNGASSSGKTTIARTIQASLSVPPIHLSSDLLSDGTLPSRRNGLEPAPWWAQGRRRFFTGYHRCVAAMASAGPDVIADSLLEGADWRAELAVTLAGFDVWLVGVHCDLDEIDRRERDRDDRQPGEGRTHIEVDEIHSFGPYDFEVETSAASVSDVASLILRSWPAPGTQRSVLFD